jgi:hypothetical protein
MDAMGWRVPAGARLRLALSLSYWPLVWPPAMLPEGLEVDRSSFILRLPLLCEHPGEWAPFEPPRTADPLPTAMMRVPADTCRKVGDPVGLA